MLIDASHSEETRVVIIEGKKVEDFDFESLRKTQLTGNIYLAKVTRVEPSLQAAFLDYGGNRHGFLAFSEVHPDYYQVPLSEQEKENGKDSDKNKELEIVSDENKSEFDKKENNSNISKISNRKFRIQEVIKVRQILLIQIVKEERGQKGAALTTYLSLAGRYCVLMPNTPKGGGISRKITNLSDRKRLKEVADTLSISEGAGLIIRTAGSKRTKLEIKRDYEFLIRQWEQIRDLTMKSIAPTPIYEEGSLIKRSIRDLYTREVEEILVDGERGYKEAKNYMKMLMPSHAKNVKKYEGEIPLFFNFEVEDHLAAMFNPVVQLKSGGYIVIDVTEALVAVDVNSGRATRESSIEETALKTNLEASDELVRQLKLRDLAGLVVIDFIDMEERKNNFSVEKRIKERLKNDRARTQVGRISSFGLLEMSRQRLRPGMIETTTQACTFCHGTGITRSDDSLALAIFRDLEEEGIRKKDKTLIVNAPVEVSNYMLNEKREHISIIEKRYHFRIKIQGDISLQSPNYSIQEDDKDVNLKNSNTKKNNVNKKNENIFKQSESDAKVNDEEESLNPKDEILNKRKRKRKRKKIPKNEDNSNLNFENKVNDIQNTDKEIENKEIENKEKNKNTKIVNSQNKKSEVNKITKKNVDEGTKEKNKIIKKKGDEHTTEKNKIAKKDTAKKNDKKNLSENIDNSLEDKDENFNIISTEIDKKSTKDLTKKEVKKNNKIKKGWWSKKSD